MSARTLLSPCYEKETNKKSIQMIDNFDPLLEAPHKNTSTKCHKKGAILYLRPDSLSKSQGSILIDRYEK